MDVTLRWRQSDKRVPFAPIGLAVCLRKWSGFRGSCVAGGNSLSRDHSFSGLRTVLLASRRARLRAGVMDESDAMPRATLLPGFALRLEPFW